MSDAKPIHLRLLLAIALLSAAALTLASDCSKDARKAFESGYPALFDAGSIVDGSLEFADVEKSSLETIARCKRCPQVPFGFINDEWLAFKAEYRDGDCLVYFRSGDRSWDGLFGREGYALWRDGSIVAVFVTLLS